MKKYKIIFIVSITFLPSVAFAAFSGMAELIRAFGGIIDSLFVVLVGLALLAFFWGLAKFIFRVGGDEKAVESGKRVMIWGLIALFVMVSVWGIVSFIGEELNIDNSSGGGGGGSGGFGDGLLST